MIESRDQSKKNRKFRTTRDESLHPRSLKEMRQMSEHEYQSELYIYVDLNYKITEILLLLTKSSMTMNLRRHTCL